MKKIEEHLMNGCLSNRCVYTHTVLEYTQFCGKYFYTDYRITFTLATSGFRHFSNKRT